MTRARSWFHSTLALLILLLVLARFLPTTFSPLTSWLDDGWMYSINMALRDKLSFGRDFVFTYGPYGGVSTRLIDPASLHLVLGGAVLLGVAFAAGLIALAFERPLFLLLLTFLLPVFNGLDELEYALPLPALLLVASAARDEELPVRTRLAVVTLIPTLGLLPLIKGSVIAISVIAIPVLTWLLWRARQPRLALAVPLGSAAALLLLWICAGQSKADLDTYFVNTASMIEGYNDAMAWQGPPDHAARAALTVIALLVLLAWGARRLPRDVALALLAAAAGLAYVAFKAGYVRQDPAHEAITTKAITLLFMILAAWLRGKDSLLAALAGLALLVGSSEQPGALASAAFAGTCSELHGVFTLITDPAGMARTESTLLTTAPALPGPIVGTVDIYSSGQTRLFNAGLAWSPRPVMQSYSAYTPRLAALNASHLLGPHAADNVFFLPEPIDNRLPALEDGPSWPALLSLYDPVVYDGVSRLVWLRRNMQSAPLVSAAPKWRLTPRFGQTIVLPTANAPLWAWIDPHLTLAGRTAGLAWRTPLISIRLDFASGQSRVYRLVPGMSRAGFLLSPVVTSALDFVRLRGRPNQQATPLNRPVSMALQLDGQSFWAWHDTYALTLAPIAIPALPGPVTMQGLAHPTQATAPAVDSDTRCYVDDVDGAPVPKTPVLAGVPMRVNGWAVFDGPRHLAAERIELGFKANDGRVYVAPTMPSWRPDVALALHLASSAGIGFTMEADTSQMPHGAYAVLAFSDRGGVARACQTGLRLTLDGHP